MIFVVVVTNVADCNAVPIGDVWYVFPAELLHPREAFLRSSKCCFVLFLFFFHANIFCAMSAIYSAVKGPQYVSHGESVCSEVQMICIWSS